MKTIFQKKRSSAAPLLHRLAMAASIGLLALSSQFSHAAIAGTVQGQFSDNTDSSFDRNSGVEAELTDISLRINLNPYGHRGKNSRRIQRGYRYQPRRSYSRQYRYDNRYNAYDRYGRPIYKEHRRKSNSNRHSYRHNYRRH